mgnify:CR=1 FL=1
MADFILGRLKFQFKGDWVTGTAYIKDDVERSVSHPTPPRSR